MPTIDTLLRQRHERTLVLSLHQPARRNALSAAIKHELHQALLDARDDPGLDAIVLRGEGGTFCSGGDLTAMQLADRAEGVERMRANAELIRLMLEFPKPILAAVEGWAAGAGLSLALACDSLIAADDARFKAGFGRVGLIGDLGLLHTLPARVGVAAARQILLYNEPLGVGEAHRIGLVDRIVPAGTTLEAALERCRTLRSHAPLALAATKQLLARGVTALLEEECQRQADLFLSSDHAEGKRAFNDKREPRFQGR
ncbi:enoyl-CoA hydratase/isomerase family protein [Stutzerimonas urumqiensis]|uniref:enoyl-CoA hydratase/isomerase family protein n=1 Tax=Stutzerimonas urumqiensis TaxID=638269 RepID=UPI003BAAB1C5